MKTAEWIFLSTSALLASGATLLTSRWLADAPETPAPVRGLSAGPGEAARLEKTLADLSAHQDELERTLEKLAARESEPARTSRQAEGEVERSVAAWMEAHAEELLSSTGPGRVDERGERQRAALRAIQAIQLGEWPEGGEAAFWQSLREEGALDDVITALEGSAHTSPYDPDLQVDLATAYGQKVFDLGPGPLQSIFRRKQDKAFDAALDVVPEHWEARFGKAMALSEWPTFLGKTSEAMHQFEILADQQERGPQRSRDMQTYLFLGNLYRESGRSDEALAVWSRGLRQFPGTTQLEAQVALLQPEDRP